MATLARPRRSRRGASPARLCAHRVLGRVVRGGAYADRAFRGEARAAALDPRERALAQQLAYGTVQRLRTVDHVIAALSTRPLERIDGALLDALRLGVFQLVFAAGVPDHAAGEQTVELAKRACPGGHGFANAVMRRAAREAPAIVAAIGDRTPDEAALRHSHPDWLAELWWQALGAAEARLLMERDNAPPERAVRANTLRVTPRELGSALRARGLAVQAAAGVPDGVVLRSPFDVEGSDLFRAGALTPQSRASMLVAHVLGPQPGERVLDMCAAPGAKTTHVAALMRAQGKIVAIERDSGRARALAENCRRLGSVNVDVVTGDATHLEQGASFDRVLLDAPCSDLGTLQARPDVRWRKTPATVGRLAEAQRALLEAAARAVRPGGTLIYSTCTISPRENEGRMHAFLSEQPDFGADDLGVERPWAASRRDPRFLQLLPHRHDTDGFFVARLRRAEAPR